MRARFGNAITKSILCDRPEFDSGGTLNRALHRTLRREWPNFDEVRDEVCDEVSGIGDLGHALPDLEFILTEGSPDPGLTLKE